MMRRLPDGTWYCEKCDRRFDSESLHVDLDESMHCEVAQH